MKTLDLLIQRWRIAKVRPFIYPGVRVLDIGCGDGALFRYYAEEIRNGIGFDPSLSQPEELPNARLLPGQLSIDQSNVGVFDVITMLAVLEHLPSEAQIGLSKGIGHLLKPEGHLIITVPSIKVDYLLTLLKWFRLIDGMHLEQHYGYDPGATPGLFAGSDMSLIRHQRFQLGLNHLFVFQRNHDDAS